ncbi:putative clathrin assembly protein At4g40080 [Nicotiana tabacum]|uniref:Clathrin assembly protein At4g40080 n=1 Tax=Nicotiana tabacum TaxID=4097 RepID=A0A1S3ZIR4_TOBAC|nr:PREDICTED: putative clathrin assembly protein At4g40080 [Nicotiana tabacum]
MSRKRKLRDLMGIFKDKASLIKANLSTKRSVSSIQVAVIRATTHASASPPHDHRISAIISAGDNSLPAIYACIEAIMDRLHRTHNPYVALKCLFVFHNILAKGSLLYKDHISFFPSSGGHNSLNLSGFYDKSDIETRELSSWVRWYANVLERNMITSRALGSYISPSSRLSINFDKITDKKGNIGFSYRSDFATEMESLVCMVEGICETPESQHFQKNDLVHEIMILVAEDYRSTQYHMMIRLVELGDRVSRLNYLDLSELILSLKRLEGCRKKLNELFIRRKNDLLWEMVSQKKMEMEKVKYERERQSFLLWNVDEKSAELTRSSQKVAGNNYQLLFAAA